MNSAYFLYIVYLFAPFVCTHAFWWAPSPLPATSTTSTTTHSDCSSESPLTLKQIPLTYFRTYTYQPLVSNPFAYPSFYGGTAALQGPTPLLHTGARFEQHYLHNYPFHPPQRLSDSSYFPGRHDQPMLQLKSGFSGQAHAPAPVSAISSSTTTTTTTTKPPTTTTSTTTTTPAPKTTTTSTSTSTTSTTSAPAPPPSSPLPLPLSAQSTQLLGITSSAAVTQRMSPFGNTPYPFPYPYPTYNRRNYMAGYNPQLYRQPYPYPDYTLYKTPQQGTTRAGSGPHIQFVPCMCPVNVNSMAGASWNSNTLSYAPQGRTTGDGEGESAAIDGDLSDGDFATETKQSETQKVTEPETVIDAKQKSQVIADAESLRNTAKPFVLLGEPFATNNLDEDAKVQTAAQSGAAL